MGFAEDKVYSHILRNLRNFGTIRVASLADSLTCLTDADRDELHAREETRGSQATVYRFYQHLRCRQGWVLDLIQALRQNNAGHLADELQEVYDTWKSGPSAAASSLPSSDRPAASSMSARTPPSRPNPAQGAPLAEQPRQDLPVGDRPPLLPSTAATTSVDLEARAPVQESLPKKLLEQESPRPTPPGSTVHDGVSDGRGEGGHLSHPVGTTQGSVGTPEVVSVSVPPEQGRDWQSRRPVCVDNGCFGNANHLHRGAPGLALGRPLPSRDASVAHSPEQTRNEPEEDSDVSIESLPRLGGATRGVGQQPPNSLPKKQPVPSSESGEALGSAVDVRSPLLIQEQFDAEKKLVKMLQEHRGDGDTSKETTTLVTTPVPRGTSSSQHTSMKSPVQEKKLPLGNKTGSSHSVPTKEKVFPALAEPALGTAVAGGSEGTAVRSASPGSSATSVCSDMKRDVELSQPGVLVSLVRGSAEVPGNPSSAASSSLGLSSDPILVSSDSWCSGGAFPGVSSGCPAPAARADPREEEAVEASRRSRSTPSWGSSSLGTHEVHVDHYPSIQLAAGNDGVGPIGSSPDLDSSSGRGVATSSSQAKVPSGDSNGPSLPYVLPAVGIAVLSAVAFLVYTRLQK
ncbi:MAVS protein, partial [Sapayoa aenigma]|nr:MAVS protein [Sapayoa aenigma]